MSVRIIYKDIAIGSDTDASVSANDSMLSTLALVPFGSGNEEKYATFEQNRWVLDGSRKIYDGGSISFMSQSYSDEDCEFTTPPKITIAFSNRYTSLGVSITFNEYPAAELTIKWYQGSTLLDSEVFNPDGRIYFCENTVTAYDKVEIEFTKTWLPFMRVSVDMIAMGLTRIFTRADLRSGKANITQEIDVSSRELAANALDWTLSSHDDVEYLFQLKQPVEAYDGETLMGVFYISDSDRIGGNVYQITCTDAIGVLGDEQFRDAVYVNQNVYSLAQTICAPFSVEMDSTLRNRTVSGILKGLSKRQALQQLCFAIGAVADTSSSAGIKIFRIPDAVKQIPEDRIRTGASVKTDAVVTAVRLTSHSYSTTGTTNEVEINGVKYYDTQTVKVITNPLATANDKQNVVDIADATLISPSNVDEIAQRLYNAVTLRTTHNVKFRVVNERVGDRVQTVTPWEDDLTGILQKASIILSGITVAASEVICP